MGHVSHFTGELGTNSLTMGLQEPTSPVSAGPQEPAVSTN